MVQIFIDQAEICVPEGTSVLAAARRLGIDVPALCCHEDYPPNTSCMCCLVRIDGRPNPVPACATKVHEGMRVESETASLHALRRTSLELLLADHAGDCHAPCENTCPAHMDIPNMLRQASEGDFRSAMATIKREIALPAILGRVCPEVCENACRRGRHDSPAAICKIKQYVADRDLASDEPYRPPIAPASGQRVAIVGGGATGLTAAYHLAQRGHACTLVEQEPRLGGRLRTEFSQTALPSEVLQAEIDAVLDLGIETRLTCPVVSAAEFQNLVGQFDAVLIAVGHASGSWLRDAGVATRSQGIQVDAQSRMTTQRGVFAAGNAVRRYPLVVQSVAEGKLAAQCIDCWLQRLPLPDRRRAFESRLARLSDGEACSFCEGASPTPRLDAHQLATRLLESEVRREAERCLECDCQALGSCRLHHYAQLYDCDAERYRGKRPYEGRLSGERTTLEWGKCIVCGICVQIANAAPDASGLTFWDRSSRMRIVPPPGVSLDAALGNAARACIEACPTGALAWRIART